MSSPNLEGVMTPQAATVETTPTASEVLDTPAAPAAPETQTPATDRISPKLQALVRRERTALERERTAKAKEAEIEAKLAAFAEKESRIAEFEKLMATNPIQALELYGRSYQDLTQIAMNEGELTPDMQIRKVDEKLNHFLKSQEDVKRQEAEQAKQLAEKREQEMTVEFKAEISTYLKDNSPRYELIAFEQCEDLVYDVIDEHYSRTTNPETGMGEVMTIAQAADKVEAALEKKYDSARSLKKVSALLARKQETTSAKPTETPRQTQKTLTNHLSATPSRPKTAPISDEERVAKAIAYARGLRS